jgi:hypothetical protein
MGFILLVACTVLVLAIVGAVFKSICGGWWK